MSALIRYDAMCVAIAEAHAIDEVKEIRSGCGSRAYMSEEAQTPRRRSLRDPTGPEQRAGQILSKMDKVKAVPGNQHWTAPQDVRVKALLILTCRQSSLAEAAIPDLDFRRLPTSDRKPSTAGLIAAKARPAHRRQLSSRRATASKAGGLSCAGGSGALTGLRAGRAACDRSNDLVRYHAGSCAAAAASVAAWLKEDIHMKHNRDPRIAIVRNIYASHEDRTSVQPAVADGDGRISAFARCVSRLPWLSSAFSAGCPLVLPQVLRAGRHRQKTISPEHFEAGIRASNPTSVEPEYICSISCRTLTLITCATACGKSYDSDMRTPSKHINSARGDRVMKSASPTPRPPFAYSAAVTVALMVWTGAAWLTTSPGNAYDPAPAMGRQGSTCHRRLSQSRARGVSAVGDRKPWIGVKTSRLRRGLPCAPHHRLCYVRMSARSS